MRPFASRYLLSFLVLFCALPAYAAQRTFVSTAGSDANTASNCATATPCRGFTAALTVTDAGGEIIVLSSGGYGPVTITKSVSIIAPEGIYAGISVFSGSGITIATAGVDVVLRGLTINGLGGTNGVNMTDGDSLSVEHCVFANFSSGSGVLVNTPAKLRVVGSLFRNDYYGVTVSSGATASISESKFFTNFLGVFATDYYGGSSVTTQVFVDRSVATGGGIGFRAENYNAGNTSRIFVADSVVSDNSTDGISITASGGTAEATVSNSRVFANARGLQVTGSSAKLIATGNTVTKNSYGLYQASAGVLESAGDNVVRDNTTNVVGSITTTFAKM